MAAQSVFTCVQCDKSYDSKSKLVRHAKIHNAVRVEYLCRLFAKKFSRKNNFKKHEKNIHSLVNARYQAVVQRANHFIIPGIATGPSNKETTTPTEWSDDGNDDLLDTLMDGLESAALCENTGKIFQINLSD